MKVKHWAGYGCVEAIRGYRTANSVGIEVVGDHERGLMPSCFFDWDWHRWLGTRFRVDPSWKVMAREWWSDKDHSDHMEVVFYVQPE